MWAQDKACFILDYLINLEIFPYKYLKLFIYQDVAMAIDEIHRPNSQKLELILSLHSFHGKIK